MSTLLTHKPKTRSGAGCEVRSGVARGSGAGTQPGVTNAPAERASDGSSAILPDASRAAFAARQAYRAGLEVPPPPVSGPELAPFPRRGNGALSSTAASIGASSGDTGARVQPAPQAPLAPVILSEAEHFLLRLFAIHDRTSERDALARAIVAYAKRIGLSPLLGKHFEDSS